MSNNPATRTVMIHIDDVGMCHGANRAFLELSASGFATCGSVMVPCPWFLEVAEVAAADRSLDLGVHLTLTAEKLHYKWRPLTDPGPASGLVDENGFFWPDVATVQARASADAVDAELRAQIDAALAAGIDVTHLDAHMGATFAPELIDVYITLGEDYEVPILLTESLASYSARNHLVASTEESYQQSVARARGGGNVFFDLVLETDWGRTGDPIDTYRPMFEAIPPGRTFLALHANAPGELEFIEPDSAYIRTGEYELFSDPGFSGWVRDLGFELTGFREIRDALRAS